MKDSLIKNKGWLHITGLFALIYSMAHLGQLETVHAGKGMVAVFLTSIDDLHPAWQAFIYIVGIAWMGGMLVELLQGNLSRGTKAAMDDVMNGVLGAAIGWCLAPDFTHYSIAGQEQHGLAAAQILANSF